MLFDNLSSPLIALHSHFPSPTVRVPFTRDANNPVALRARETRAGMSALVPHICHVKKWKKCILTVRLVFI